MEDERTESLFPKMRIATEGAFLTPQGNYVQTMYVDLSGQVEKDGMRLVKATGGPIWPRDSIHDSLVASKSLPG